MAITVIGTADAMVLAQAMLTRAVPGITIVGTPTLVALSNFALSVPKGTAGTNFQAGTFTGGLGMTTANSLPWATGIILTTGSCIGGFVRGPNLSGALTAFFNPNPAPGGLRQPGSAVIEAMLTAYFGTPSSTSYDACSLTLQFITGSAGVGLSLVFGSDEYNEFVGLQFTDACAVFLDGVNIATLSDGTIVAVNAINANVGKHPEYFLNNPVGANTIDLQYDGYVGVKSGFPVTLTASVTPGVVHTLEIVIADLADGSLDSGVFVSDFYAIDGQPPGAPDTLPPGSDSGGGAGCLAEPSSGSDSGGGSGCLPTL